MFNLKLVVVGTVMAACAAFTNRNHPIRHEMVASIRSKTTAWEAHDPSTNPLGNMTREELLALVSTYTVDSNDVNQFDLTPSNALPTNFDPRTEKFNKCIHPIRDQAQCGSCWAFGATEALSDRFCINGLDVVLAPQDPVSCDTNNYGCDGGYLNMVWTYLTNKGAVTEGCWPYASQQGVAPSCASQGNKCSDGSKWTKYQCKKNTVVNPKTVSAIQSELYDNGPLEGAFTVYEDFFNYKSGVYYHVSGGVAGGHAIKVLGWGVENGLNYWLCANSWGGSWGLQGFFKIKQGDSGINGQMYACTPDTTPKFELY